MKKHLKLILVVSLFLILATVVYSAIQDRKGNSVKAKSPNEIRVDPISQNTSTSDSNAYIVGLEIPSMSVQSPIVRHIAYSLQYSEKHEQAYWIAYVLTGEETQKSFERSNDFNVDPKISSGSATEVDYKGSGYDRGHLAPAADMSWSEETMQESFYYSNMSPQEPGFNRGIWKKLEELVRTWARDYDSIHIVTGPVLSSDLVEIGPNGVDIPKYYYKVILDNTGKDAKAIGFLMPNASSSEPLMNFAVSVDRIEKETGINFFPKLEDSREVRMESTICVSCWNWESTASKTDIKPQTEGQKSTSTGTSQQCKGTTKAGARCSRKTSDSDGYCYQHKP